MEVKAQTSKRKCCVTKKDENSIDRKKGRTKERKKENWERKKDKALTKRKRWERMLWE